MPYCVLMYSIVQGKNKSTTQILGGGFVVDDYHVQFSMYQR